MTRFVKIGADIINLDCVTHVTALENQSGLSDRLVIGVGGATVTLDSGIMGKKEMDAVREKLYQALAAEDWDSAQAA